jgi:hypothetical protein
MWRAANDRIACMIYPLENANRGTSTRHIFRKFGFEEIVLDVKVVKWCNSSISIMLKVMEWLLGGASTKLEAGPLIDGTLDAADLVGDGDGSSIKLHRAPYLMQLRHAGRLSSH